MKDRVVCISDNFYMSKRNGFPHPIKGEIYEIDGLHHEDGKDYYFIVGFNYIAPISKKRMAYSPNYFRPVDLTYGPAICETIEQQIELEKVLI